MRSNCQVYAWGEFFRRCWLWRAAGYPRRLRPRISLMPSNLVPHWIPHAQVSGGGLPAMEFVPLDTSPLPLWKLPFALLFLGRARPVDFPDTAPPDEH